MRHILKTGIGVTALVLYLALAAYSGTVFLKQFTFNDDGALKEWNRMILKGRVDYELVRRGPDGFVRALSERSCSALYYKIEFGLSDYPLLNWRWKVVRFPDLSKARTAKERDDYAARVYVIFPILNFSCSKFIEYVWSEDIPAGTVMTSPYGSNVKIIVVRSGMAKDDSWAYESRNIYEDYLAVFGKRPDKKAGAVAIMCDADSTKTVAEAMFDDIAIGR